MSNECLADYTTIVLLQNVERIKNFVLCHQDWTIESGEVTATLKPIRSIILENYKNDIEKMYQ